MRLPFLIEKELLQLKRNSFMPRLILVFPIAIMLVAPWITNMEVKNINVRVVDNDRSASSERLVHRIESSDYFIFKGLSETYDNALKDVEKGNTDLILTIPQKFEKDFVNGNRPTLFVAANAVNGTKGGMGSSYLAQIIQMSLKDMMANSANASVQNIAQPQLQFSTLNYYNPHQNYKIYMIPALMALIVILLCGFLPALNIVGEKEAGTIEQINVTPVSKAEFIMAKLIPYWVIGLLVLTIALLLSWAVYGITPRGNVLLIYLLFFQLSLVFSGLGLLISNYSNAMQEAMFVMWFFVVCLILLSGLFTPVTSMPEWAQNLTLLNPARYFIDAMRNVFVRGGGFISILPQVIALAIFGVIMDALAIISYKKNS